MEISKFGNSKIEESKWVQYAENRKEVFLPRNSWYKDEEFKPNFFIKGEDGKPLKVELRWRSGKIYINYSKLDDLSIVLIDKIASYFGGLFLDYSGSEYPKSKIIAAQKRLAKKSQEPQVEYQKESFGGNNMWLAIRSSLEGVKDFFNLDGEEKSWSEALENMHACEGMFMYEFRGWTFIAGQSTNTLFNCQVKGEKVIEKCHVDRLIEWGRTFSDVQLFMHYDRSIHFNAFYRILNNKIIYGEYETESYKKEYGKLPKNVKDLPDNNANTVALEWSYDPDYLRFQKELENAAAWIVNVKEEA